ncbi:MAG: hypothetical protein HYZ25_14525 [Chloroflexi bacterium]|nr:hypothetical protein [Chloroflexota bacterium]
MSDTALTILGMIAAFITAAMTTFFSEPVKNWFAEKNKLNSIRLSLYKEIAQNAFNIRRTIGAFDETIISELSNTVVSNKCYKNILEHNVGEYYRLDDVISIDAVYYWINFMLQPSTFSQKNHGELIRKYGLFFIKSVSDNLKNGKLSKKVMKEAVGKEDLQELIEPKIVTKYKPS